MKDIQFGTDGWRDRMYHKFNEENVIRVVRAIAAYTKQENGQDRGIVVGYDARFFSDHFAEVAARVLSAENVQVYTLSRDLPTPVVAYAVNQLDAFGAIMFTASHNPPEYNGIKFIPYYAGPATPEITTAIEALIPEEHSPLPAWNKAKVMAYDPLNDYFEHLNQLVDVESIRRSGLRLAYDSMHGSGRGVLDAFFEDVDLVVMRDQRDPLFDGGMPDPQESLLTGLRDWVASNPNSLGLATDGDADRFGIIDEGGNYITPNQLIPIICYHLIKNRGFSGVIGRSAATTHLLDRLATHYGLETVETPVGFKYLGAVMREKQVVICGEESGGLSIGGHIPEKDGILACALAAELRVKEGRSLRAVLEEIWGLVGAAYSKRVDYHIEPGERECILEGVQKDPLTEVNGVAVREIQKIDGYKLILANGDWCLIRPSGTEPLFRLYFETGQEQDMDPMVKAIQAWFARCRV